jgi:hypothetical protein
MATPKGVSGNPTGRPKYSGEWAAAIYKILQEEDPKTRKRKLHLAAARLVKAAIDGNIEALKVIGDRIDGKPTQEHQLGGEFSAVVYHVVTGVPRADDPQD